MGPAREAFCAQPNLFWATVATVLAIAWPPPILAIPDSVGYFSNWWWVDGTALTMWIHNLPNGIIGGLDIKNVELCDDTKWISADWELNRDEGTGHISVESVEK